MSQFTLYQNTDKATKKTYPYFLDVQSNLVSILNSRLVIPLTPATKLDTSAPEKLCPVIPLDEGEFALLTHQLTSVPVTILKNPITNLETFRDEVISAIDLLITGI